MLISFYSTSQIYLLLLVLNNDGKMEGVALLLCEQQGGREGWRSDELVRSQGQIPTGDGVLEGQVPGRDVSEGQVL